MSVNSADKKPSETITERFREIVVIRFNRVCACCGMRHNAEMDLGGTGFECANRLWIFGFHNLVYLFLIHFRNTVII